MNISAEIHKTVIMGTMIGLFNDLPDVDSNAVVDEAESVCRAYSTSNRHYHTMERLYEMISISYLFPVIPKRRVFLLSLIYHNLIHITNKDVDNGCASAEKAIQCLKEMGFRINDELLTVSEWIRSVQYNKPLYPEDTDCEFFLDCVNYIYGSDPERYLRYVHDLKFEYTQYSMTSKEYDLRRLKKLELLLEGGIYKTPLFNLLFAEKAKKNIFTEISKFSG